jgi:hypothetical protein
MKVAAKAKKEQDAKLLGSKVTKDDQGESIKVEFSVFNAQDGEAEKAVTMKDFKNGLKVEALDNDGKVLATNAFKPEVTKYDEKSGVGTTFYAEDEEVALNSWTTSGPVNVEEVKEFRVTYIVNGITYVGKIEVSEE